jgi:hypothetical protein
MNLVNLATCEPLGNVLGDCTEIGKGSGDGQLWSETGDMKASSGEKVIALATYAIERKGRRTVLAHEGLGCSDDVAVVSATQTLVAGYDD